MDKIYSIDEDYDEKDYTRYKDVDPLKDDNVKRSNFGAARDEEPKRLRICKTMKPKD